MDDPHRITIESLFLRRSMNSCMTDGMNGASSIRYGNSSKTTTPPLDITSSAIRSMTSEKESISERSRWRNDDTLRLSLVKFS